jgi:hypothetical protein
MRSFDWEVPEGWMHPFKSTKPFYYILLPHVEKPHHQFQRLIYLTVRQESWKDITHKPALLFRVQVTFSPLRPGTTIIVQPLSRDVPTSIGWV